jgi:hypothetical protein
MRYACQAYIEEQYLNNVQFPFKNCSFFRKLSYGDRRGSP